MITHIDDVNERERRAIGQPVKAEPFRAEVAAILAREPDLLSVEILRRAKLKGYAGLPEIVLREFLSQPFKSDERADPPRAKRTDQAVERGLPVPHADDAEASSTPSKPLPS